MPGHRYIDLAMSMTRPVVQHNCVGMGPCDTEECTKKSHAVGESGVLVWDHAMRRDAARRRQNGTMLTAEQYGRIRRCAQSVALCTVGGANADAGLRRASCVVTCPKDTSAEAGATARHHARRIRVSLSR